MFTKFIIQSKDNRFEELFKATNLEDVTKGRKGAIIADISNKDNVIPLVRTTTGYSSGVQKFSKIHYQIIDDIRKASGYSKLEFNNAMVEVYNSDYCKMGYHTDQALDLVEDSYICLFSCYDSMHDGGDSRKLKIKEKASGKCSEIVLDHNSAVLFSVQTNGKHVHKIVLDDHKSSSSSRSSSQWLGITFRLSKTFIKFIDGKAVLDHTNTVLQLATEKERREFLKHKSLENSTEGYYKYPEIAYTVSSSDMMPIVK